MKRFKVTRIEIWEVEHEMDPTEVDQDMFTDGTYHYTPKQIIEFKVEKLIP